MKFIGLLTRTRLHKKKTWNLLLLFFLVTSSSLKADGFGYGVIVQAETSKTVQAVPGEVLTMSFSVQNRGATSDTFFLKMEVPEGWSSIPEILPTIPLDRNEQTFEVIGIKVPESAPMGSYNLSLVVQGTHHPDLLGQGFVTVEVLESQELSLELQQKTEFAIPGRSYYVQAIVKNGGNTTKNLELQARSNGAEKVKVTPNPRFSIEQGERKEFKIEVKLPFKKKFRTLDMLHVDLADQNSHKSLENQTLCTQLNEPTPLIKGLDKYRLLPCTSTFVAGFNNYEKTLFINTEGGGYLDEKKTRYLSYLFRIPILQQTPVFRQMGGIPEHYFVNYTSPHIDAYGADGVYQLSPLTISTRYGRGGMLTLKSKYAQMGSLVVSRTSGVKQADFGLFLKVMPVPSMLGFQASYYYTEGKLIDSNYTKKNTANILGVSGNFSYDPYLTVQGEWGLGTSHNTKGTSNAMFLQGKGKPFSWFWYNFQRIYAPLDFLGYYSNQVQQNYSMGFLLWKRLNLMGSYTLFNDNLDRDPIFVEANKTQRVIGEATLILPIRLFISASYNNYKVRDRLSDLGFVTNYGALRLIQTFKNFTLMGLGQLGHYKQWPIDPFTKTWQNYSAYTYYRFLGQVISLYSRLGYIYRIHTINWNQTYGTSANLKYGKFNGQFNYEQSFNNFAIVRKFYQASLRYTFRNQQSLELNGNIIKNFGQKGIYRALLTYRVPWGLPVGRKEGCTSIKGRAIYNDNGIIKPSANTIITCNEIEVKTDKKGRYRIDNLKPGPYLMNVPSDLDRGLITDRPLPIILNLEDKTALKYDIGFTRPSSIDGDLFYYKQIDEKDSSYVKERPARAEITFTSEQGEIVTLCTNTRGVFRLPNLRPGRWKGEIKIEDLSYSYEIEEPQFEILLHPGEKRYLKLRVLKLQRAIQYLD